MQPTDTSIIFSKVHTDVKFLASCLIEVLEALGETDSAELLSKIIDQEDISDRENKLEEKHIQVLSIYLQLLNLVEENASVQYRRRLIEKSGPRLSGALGVKLLDIGKSKALHRTR